MPTDFIKKKFFANIIIMRVIFIKKISKPHTTTTFTLKTFIFAIFYSSWCSWFNTDVTLVAKDKILTEAKKKLSWRVLASFQIECKFKRLF